jgi:hypothetical protein
MPQDNPKKLTPRRAGRANFISAETWQTLLDLVARGEVIPDPVQFETFKGKGRTFFRLRPETIFPTAPGAGGLVFPFALSVRKDGSSIKVKIAPGTFHGLSPKLDGTALDASTAPEKTITSTTTFYLAFTYDPAETGYAQWSPTIETSDEAPVIDEDGYSARRTIGIVTVASGEGSVTKQTLKNDVEAELVGNLILWWAV